MKYNPALNHKFDYALWIKTLNYETYFFISLFPAKGRQTRQTRTDNAIKSITRPQYVTGVYLIDSEGMKDKVDSAEFEIRM